jgi:hypothetical protein
VDRLEIEFEKNVKSLQLKTEKTLIAGFDSAPAVALHGK